MDCNTERLVSALTRVCVFVHTSRHWEDYDNMHLDSNALIEMTQWVNNTQGLNDEAVGIIVSEVSRSQYSALKTDWTIGCVQATSVVSMLDGNEKGIVGSYLESSLPVILEENPGVAKAVDTILNAM